MKLCADGKKFVLRVGFRLHGAAHVVDVRSLPRLQEICIICHVADNPHLAYK